MDKQTQYHIDFAASRWVAAGATGARYKVFKQSGRQIRMVEFSREFTEPDWCRKGHIGYVLEGNMEIDFGGKLVAYKQGDGLFIPAGEKNKHRLYVLSDKLVLIMVEDI
jgi:quercetin dioxygenase-like cupin family protein